MKRAEKASIAATKARIMAQALATAPDAETVQIPGTRIVWTGLEGWLRAVWKHQETHRAAAPSYARGRALYLSLKPKHITACRDERTLEILERLLSSSRHDCAGLRHGLSREISREELGRLLVHTRNHALWVRYGCPQRKDKGPRFDVAKIPDAALEGLVQRHKDMAIVEACRRELAARRAMKDPGSWSPLLRRVMGMETPMDRAQHRAQRLEDREERGLARPSYSPQLSLF